MIPKRYIIERAYGECGQAITEFELSPEEMLTGLRMLNDLMAELQAQGIALGYNAPTSGDGSSTEDSGLDRSVVRAVSGKLARDIAPLIGKTVAPDANGSFARAWSTLLARNTVIPQMEMRRQTPRGAGNRMLFRSPYFFADISVGEIDQ
jgi:hypothetical protein